MVLSRSLRMVLVAVLTCWGGRRGGGSCSSSGDEESIACSVGTCEAVRLGVVHRTLGRNVGLSRDPKLVCRLTRLKVRVLCHGVHRGGSHMRAIMILFLSVYQFLVVPRTVVGSTF